MTFGTRHARSPIGSSGGSRRSCSVYPVGLTIAQRQAQLVAHIAPIAASGVEQVAATADVTRNIAEQALTTTIHATRSIEDVVCEHV